MENVNCPSLCPINRDRCCYPFNDRNTIVIPGDDIFVTAVPDTVTIVVALNSNAKARVQCNHLSITPPCLLITRFNTVEDSDHVMT